MSNSSISKNKKYILIIGDVIILYFSLWLTLLARFGNPSQDLVIRHIWPFSFVFLVWITIFFIDELYELNFLQGAVKLFVKILRGTVITALVASTFFYFATDWLFTIKPQRVLLIQILIALILLYVWRIIFHKLSRSPKISNKILIIGFNKLAEEIIEKVNSTPQLGLKVAAILTDNTQVPDKYKNLVIQKPYSELKNVCTQHKIKSIVSAVNPRENSELLKNLFACLPLKINFYEIAGFYEKITGKIPVQAIEQMWFLENLEENKKNLYARVAKIIDTIVAIVLLIITLPFLPFVALAVKLTSKGPVLFKQVRVGQNSENFKVIKFRTMVNDAEKEGAKWATKNDARVTTVGKFLRKTRIDEIPQLVNVLKGEMSLIGPRPERPEFVSQLQESIPFYNERLLVKPGLTGWAQVVGPSYGGSVEESLEKLQYDLYYIKNRSLGLDISIYLRTIKTVLTRKGH